MMEEKLDVKIKREFRLKTRELVKDLDGNVIAELWTTRGTDGNKLEIVVIDPNLEVIVRDATV